MKLTQTLGVIGVGNMGAAILEGLLAKKIVSAGQVTVYDKIAEKAKEFSARYKVALASSNSDLVKRSDIVLLAFKPQDLVDFAAGGQVSDLSPFRKSHVVISILAGTPIAKIRQSAGPNPKIVRAMPNLGAKVGEAVTAICIEAISGTTMPSPLSFAEMIFSGCGKTLSLEEKYFDLVTAVSGSGPAYFFLLMERLMKECTDAGLTTEQARTLAVQTALGAGLLAKSAKETPEELRKMVTSKGGTTEAALNVLFSKNFPEIFHEALQAALTRGRELSK